MARQLKLYCPKLNLFHLFNLSNEAIQLCSTLYLQFQLMFFFMYLSLMSFVT